MKYTILINQQAVVAAGLHIKTDLVDWAILDYICAWQLSPNAVRRSGKVWINYAHIIREMPLLGLNNKQAVSKRILKIKELGLINVEQDQDDKRLYIETTSFYENIVVFNSSHPSTVVDTPSTVVDTPSTVVDTPSTVVDTPSTVVDIHTTIKNKPSENKPSGLKDIAQAQVALLKNAGVDETLANDFLQLRKSKRSPVNETVLQGLLRESAKAGISLSDALRICVERGWQGFNANWDWQGSGKQQARVINKPVNCYDDFEYEPSVFRKAQMKDVDGERVLQ